jgi:hypothetical protein
VDQGCTSVYVGFVNYTCGNKLGIIPEWYRGFLIYLWDNPLVNHCCITTQELLEELKNDRRVKN